jgi:hypothetical protein
MGSPPPPNYPSPSASASVDVVPAAPAATICGFAIGIPRLKFGLSISLAGLGFPPELPIPWLSLKLTCSLSDPVDVSGGLAFGGGRPVNSEPDPDDNENAA